MIAFDTNVLVRVLASDDPTQSKKAEQAFLDHANGDGVFVSILVLAEAAWVLGGAYAWDRSTIHESLSRLLRTRGVVIEEVELAETALRRFAEGNADLADYFIMGKAESAGAALLTFDRKLARESGVNIL